MMKLIRLYQQVEWLRVTIIVCSMLVVYLLIGAYFRFNDGPDTCKTVKAVGGCTKYDCRVSFTDDTHGTVRGPSLEGDKVCRYDFRDFWEHTE